MRNQVLPWVVPGSARILDLGCGDGATLRALHSPRGTFAVGVDLSSEGLKTAKALTPYAHFVCARGEQLPFRDECFDSVICGVALPYMDISRTLAEVRRVLKPSGGLWASLHSFRMVRKHWLRSLRAMDWRDLVCRTYVLLNGVVFHFMGRVFRLPLRPDRCESFQTRRGMRIALRRAGFTEEETVKFFVTTAIKPAVGETRTRSKQGQGSPARH